MQATKRSVALIFVLLASCGRTPAPRAGAEPGTRPARNPNVISYFELQDPTIASQNANYAIQQLRPSFFRTRGPTSFKGAGMTHISQDFGPLQPLANLTTIDVRTLIEIRYLEPIAATARFGINTDGGAVIVLLSTAQ